MTLENTENKSYKFTEDNLGHLNSFSLVSEALNLKKKKKERPGIDLFQQIVKTKCFLQFYHTNSQVYICFGTTPPYPDIFFQTHTAALSL